jgi:hypothetical protein
MDGTKNNESFQPFKEFKKNRKFTLSFDGTLPSDDVPQDVSKDQSQETNFMMTMDDDDFESFFSDPKSPEKKDSSPIVNFSPF